MKKTLTILCASVMALFLLSCENNGGGNGKYVDLGLPSGTLWDSQNPDSYYYTYEEAFVTFGLSLPTKEQFEELLEYGTWEYMPYGFKVTGPNGKSIFFPELGCNIPPVVANDSFGVYWSRTKSDIWEGFNYALLMEGDSIYSMTHASQESRYSVRLVK